MGLPLCHVASAAMRCFDCTWRMRTRAEHVYYIHCESRINAVLGSESRFGWSKSMLHTSQLFKHTLLCSRHTSHICRDTHYCVPIHIIHNVSRHTHVFPTHIAHNDMYRDTQYSVPPSITHNVCRDKYCCVPTHITHNNVRRDTQ
jgi:hypothetical protein